MSLNVASRSSSSSTRSSSYSTPPSSFSSTRPSPSYSYSSSSSSSSSFPPRCVSRLTSSSLSSPSPCSDVWLDLAQEFSSTSAKISSAPAPARVIYGADPDFQEALDRAQCVIRRAKVVLLHRKIQKLHAEINLPRARPSQTGSQVKQRFTFDHRGPAVPAATQGSTRGRSPKPVLKSILKPSASTQIASQTGSQVKQRFTFDHRGPAVPAATQGSTRGRSPKPVLKSILKPSTSTQIASRQVPACAPINRSGERNLCEASAEAYAAPWRSLPAREWANDKLPIERLDRWALRQQRIKKRELLADGARPKRVEFAQTLVTGFRTVSR